MKMEPSIDSSDWAAGPRERRRALLCAFVFILAAVAVTPVATTVLPASFPLIAMILAASVTSIAITAVLLLVQARALGSFATAVQSAGFAFAAATLTAYAVTSPGMFEGLPDWVSAEAGNNGLLWFFWHIGLLWSAISFDQLRRFDRSDPLVRRRGLRVIAGFVTAFFAIVAVAIWADRIPAAYTDTHWTASYAFFMAPVIIVLAAIVIATAIRRTVSTVLDVWIGVVALAMILDVYLTLVGVTRFSIGWYASRIEVLLATTAVLGVLISQGARMYAALYERATILEGEAHTDILTGMPNRRRFDEEITRAFGSAVRRSSPLAVAIADIDRFKDYNDAFGHQAGDDALHRIAQCIADSVDRSGDFAARYGGEEFVVILEDTTLIGAVAVAERIRSSVLEAGITAPGGGILSISIGVADRSQGETIEDLIGRADFALYDAKDGGRNRVVARSATETVLANEG